MEFKKSYVFYIVVVAFIYRFVNLGDILLMITVWYPYDPVKSTFFNMYRDYLMRDYQSFREPMQVPEIAVGATWDEILEITHGLTTPAVIRGLAVSNPKVKDTIANHWWWAETLGPKNASCMRAGTYAGLFDCSFEHFFTNWNKTDPENIYIAGPTHYVFDQNPILKDLFYDPVFTEFVEAGREKNVDLIKPQMFMGFGGQGASIHAAGALNIFRQIVGHKKWWLIDFSKKVEMYTSYAAHGMSVQTEGWLGHPGNVNPFTTWIEQLPRYEFTLNPGDVLFNTPWTFHGTYNSGPGDDLTNESFNIGVAHRTGGPTVVKASFRAAPLNTFYLMCRILWYGSGSLERGKAVLFEGELMRNQFSEALADNAEKVHDREGYEAAKTDDVARES